MTHFALLQRWAIATLSCLLAATPVLAESYQPPPGLGAPGPREGAGTRGCVLGNPASLIALMPESNVGWTTAAYPDFYWYLPLNLASFVEFTLFAPAETGDSREVIYQTRFAVTGDAGIARLALPEGAGLPPLAVGDRYYWQVAIFCNPDSDDGDLRVGGWVERRSPTDDLAQALATAPPGGQVELYAEHGYWFDAIAGLAALKQVHPDDDLIQARWHEFLASVGLTALAEQPFLQEVRVTEPTPSHSQPRNQ